MAGERDAEAIDLLKLDIARQITDLNPIATFVINAQHVVTHWNLACERLTGVKADSVIGTNLQWQAFYPAERPVMADVILDGARESDIDHFYHGKYRPSRLIDGAFEAEDFFPNFGDDGRWLFFTAAPLLSSDGEVIGAIETLQDITERRRAEAALKAQEARLASIVNGSSVATVVIDREHRITHWNHACEVLTGIFARDMVGTKNQWKPFYPTARPIMADLVLDGAMDPDVDRYYHGRFRRSRAIANAVEAEDFFPHLGTMGRWLFFTAAPLRDDQGQVIGAIETLQDFSERKRAEIALQESEERHRQMSITDSLTGLGNARHFYAEIEREMVRARRYNGPLSVLLLDVDHFKQYNDTWGHLAGDLALQGLAETIRACLRRPDSAYRYGGEEFVILMPHSDLQGAIVVAERLRHEFSQRVLVAGEGVVARATVSIGAAELRPEDNVKTLLHRADTGTYQAKAAGRNCVIAVA